MSAGWLFLLTFICALGSGICAGVFFAFSTFVMKALSRLPPASGIAAMQSINVFAINPVFMTALFGTALLAAALAVLSWQEPASIYAIAGAVLHIAGMVGVTMLCNVPRNHALAAVDPGSADGARLWAGYLVSWTFWNHVRTAAGLAAMAAFILAMMTI